MVNSSCISLNICCFYYGIWFGRTVTASAADIASRSFLITNLSCRLIRIIHTPPLFVNRFFKKFAVLKKWLSAARPHNFQTAQKYFLLCCTFLLTFARYFGIFKCSSFGSLVPLKVPQPCSKQGKPEGCAAPS